MPEKTTDDDDDDDDEEEEEEEEEADDGDAETRGEVKAGNWQCQNQKGRHGY